MFDFVMCAVIGLSLITVDHLFKLFFLRCDRLGLPSLYKKIMAFVQTPLSMLTKLPFTLLEMTPSFSYLLKKILYFYFILFNYLLLFYDSEKNLKRIINV